MKLTIISYKIFVNVFQKLHHFRHNNTRSKHHRRFNHFLCLSRWTSSYVTQTGCKHESILFYHRKLVLLLFPFFSMENSWEGTLYIYSPLFLLIKFKCDYYAYLFLVNEGVKCNTFFLSVYLLVQIIVSIFPWINNPISPISQCTTTINQTITQTAFRPLTILNSHIYRPRDNDLS